MLDIYYIDLCGMTAQEKQTIKDKIDGWDWTTSEDIVEGQGLIGLKITWERKYDFEEFLKASGLEGRIEYRKLN